MFNSIKLIWLSRKARRIVLSIYSRMSNQPGGIHITPQLIRRAEKFDQLMDRIYKLDPSALRKPSLVGQMRDLKGLE